MRKHALFASQGILINCQEGKEIMRNAEQNNVISPSDDALIYCGRIDFTEKEAPVFVYPYSSVSAVFTGRSISIILRNHHICWENNLGYVIDGVQGRIQLPENGDSVTLVLEDDLSEGEHELFLFKRQDACHYFDFLGFVLEKGAKMKASSPLPERRIEVYGDSVSAGEVSEALNHVGKPDPKHNGEYSNAYYSYAAYTARMLNAQLHDIAQGGIALLDGTGYFAPDFGYTGMESRYDKLKYNPELGKVTEWDFSRYTPQVVIVAIGQNDSFPEDYMKEDYFCEKSALWRDTYEKLLRKLRGHYPEALIITSTTILEHDAGWDRSIKEVCDKTNDKRIVNFLYSSNGCGTPGHIRKPEAEDMANELSAFIESFGEAIWK